MQVAPGKFRSQTLNNIFEPDTYAMDASGIRLNGSYTLAWSAITRIEAWIKNHEDDEVSLHLQLLYENNYQLHISTGEPDVFTDLEAALARYLGLAVNWSNGSVEEECQWWYRSWHRGWQGGRHKPVVYQRAACAPGIEGASR